MYYPKLMECPNCHSNIPDGSSVCPICKKSLSQQSGSQSSSLYPGWQNQMSQPQYQQPQQYQPQPSQYQQPQQYQPQPQYQPTGAAILEGKKRKLMIWSIISLLFVCVPVGIYGLVKHSSISKIADPAKAVSEADRVTKNVVIWTTALLILGFILGFLVGLS